MWLLEMLAEHTVLSSTHINTLWNNSLRNTNRRLLALHRLGLLDSFRPHTARGSAPEHYLLARTGAGILAARHATTPAALGWSPDLITRTSYSPTLTHDLGATTFFTTLASASRTNVEGDRLNAWWSEQRCARVWGDLVHPDAHGRLTRRDGHTVAFFLEYDTGTEPHARLAAKLDAYADAAPVLGGRPLVLFTLPSSRREVHLHERLTGHPALQALDVATTGRDHIPPMGTGHDPLGPVWLRLGLPAHRQRLAELPTEQSEAAKRRDAAAALAGPPAPHPLTCDS
ncbi:replication-relaxation family protein [Streptacidiphilus neutrinimicus]|uniref:replication-relaxation family protein n=1 Tax=Streptacidiphilus neutrinimicus TaxID=105420 RepID=UPI0006950944|nr:replication-relaxation family protein [Streptacidiphilus neutrinimicus]